MFGRARPLISLLTVGSLAVVSWRLLQAHSVVEIAPVAARIFALSVLCWWAHIGVHEAAHWLVSKLVGFTVLEVQWGPVSFSFVDKRFAFKASIFSGGVLSIPQGERLIGPRLKRVALAGPYATLMTLGGLFALAPKPLNVNSVFSIGLAMGVVVLISAAIPGDQERGFSDLQLWRQDPKTFGFWLYECALAQAMRGVRPPLEISYAELNAIHQQQGSPPQPIDIIWVVKAIEEGRQLEAMAWLRAARSDNGEILQWLRADMAMQHGALIALADGDVSEAQACLVEVEKYAAVPWYPLVLKACIAAKNEKLSEARELFAQWQAKVDAHEHKALLTAGNGWLVDALEVRLAGPEGLAP